MPNRTPEQTKAMLKTGRDRWQLARSASQKQRDRITEDLRFLVDHWPADIRAARLGQAAQAGMPPVPARPCIQVDKLSEPINRVLNQERASDFGIQIVAADDFADLGIELDDTEITLREGLTRRIQRAPETADARTWAFKRAVQGGEGYELVMTRFVSGKSWDKEVYVHRIYDQSQVELDPAHTQPDGSDATWEFIGAWVPWNVYKAENPSSKARANQITDASENEFTAWAEEMPEWVNITENAKAVFVVTYWYVEFRSRTLLRLSDGSSAWKDEWNENADDRKVIDSRDAVERVIRFAKLDGINDFPLEEDEWEGPDMPIVKFIGEEMQPYDGARRVQGMVRPSRDSQFGFDAMVSKQVEAVALAPTPALRVDPDAIAGFEGWYQVMNTRTLPFAPYRTYDDEGRQLAPAERMNAEPNLLPIAQSIALFDQSIQATTATSDPALGRADPTVKSARHAKFLIDESNFGTSQYLDNYTRSLRYEGQIINGLLYPIYGARPGRMARILTGEGENETMFVNAPPQEQQQNTQNQTIAKKVGTLTKDAKFNVIVKVTKSFSSRREQEATIISDLLTANPVFMTWFGDLFFKNQDGPGHEQMAERAKVMLDPKIQQMLAEKESGQEPSVEMLKQQLGQMQQQLQHAEAAMQELADEARGKKIEAQTKIQIAELQARLDEQKAIIDADLKAREMQFDLEKSRMDNATKIRVAEIAAETKGIISGHELAHEADAMGRSQAHEAAMQEMSQDHDATMQHAQAVQASQDAEAEREHEVAMAGASAAEAQDEGERSRAHETQLASTKEST